MFTTVKIHSENVLERTQKGEINRDDAKRNMESNVVNLLLKFMLVFKKK